MQVLSGEGIGDVEAIQPAGRWCITHDVEAEAISSCIIHDVEAEAIAQIAMLRELVVATGI